MQKVSLSIELQDNQGIILTIEDLWIAQEFS